MQRNVRVDEMRYYIYQKLLGSKISNINEMHEVHEI